MTIAVQIISSLGIRAFGRTFSIRTNYDAELTVSASTTSISDSKTLSFKPLSNLRCKFFGRRFVTIHNLHPDAVVLINRYPDSAGSSASRAASVIPIIPILVNRISAADKRPLDCVQCLEALPLLLSLEEQE